MKIVRWYLIVLLFENGLLLAQMPSMPGGATRNIPDRPLPAKSVPEVTDNAVSTGIKQMRGVAKLSEKICRCSSHAVALSPDGKWYAIVKEAAEQIGAGQFASATHVIELRDVATNNVVRELRDHMKPIYALAFSPDGKRLASGGNDSRIRLWDLTDAKKDEDVEPPCLFEKRMGVRCLVFSPDGKYLAAGGFDPDIVIWDVSSMKMARTIKGHNARTLAIAYMPDGKSIVTGHGYCKIRVWNLSTGNEAMSLAGHEATWGDKHSDVLAVAVSPDGKRIASGGIDNTVRLWDATTGKELYCLRRGSTGRDQDGFGVVAFSADGDRLLAGGGDGFVRMWNMDQLLKAAASPREKPVP